MKYMGSKNRIAKFIIPFFEMVLTSEKLDYWEPFVGGANMIDKVDAGNKFGSDNNGFLIEMWKKLQNGWEPPKGITKEEYSIYRTKFNDNAFYLSDMAEIGFIGFICSYGGKFYDGGYANISGNRNYQEEAYRNIMKQVPKILDVTFFHGDYSSYTPEFPTLIYCDIPYQGTTEYSVKGFDHHSFFIWCRKMVSLGHHVFVSEFTAPEDFELLWEKDIKTHIKKEGVTILTEKLFYKGNFKFNENCSLREWL